jgi:hypothetical protein
MCGRATDRPQGRRAAIAVALGCTLIVRIAVAAPPDPVEATIEEGVKLRTEGRHAEALELFKKAHAEHPSARTLAQMGLAEGSLRRWVDAEGHLAEALATHDTPWIENRRTREALEQALSAVRSHIGSVAVVGPAGAEVSIDQKVVGRLPLAAPLRLPEGTVHVRGSALGHKPVTVETVVAGGGEITVMLDLGLAQPPAFPAAPIIDDGPLPVSSSARWKTWTGTSLLAASAAALATGIVWLAVDGNGTCDAPAGARCQRLYDTKAQGWVAIGVGAAAGIGGGLLLWQGTRTETRVSFAPGRLTLERRF